MYDVGQTVFVILEKKQRIVPVQVVEQIVRRSHEGESIQYYVKVPGCDDPIDINSLGNEIYVNLDDVKINLKKKAESAIKKMIDAARNLAITHFKGFNDSHTREERDITANKEENHVTVDLGDGQNAKIDISDLEKLSL